MLKKSLLLVLAMSMMGTVIAAQGQNDAATVPFKTHVATVSPTLAEKSAGKMQLVFRIYGQAQNGSPLFEETQTVAISGDNLYADIGSATAGGVPNATLQNRQHIWLEYARASAPELPLEDRFSFTLSGGGPDISFSVDPSVCYTCGGGWPVYGGAIYTTTGANERGSGCSGNITHTSDSSPYICGRL
jgi:hypothetical protein